MFGIVRFSKGIITNLKSLRNYNNELVTLLPGDNVTLYSLTNNLFAIKHQTKGIMYLPSSLFNNNFRLLERGI